MNKPIKFANGNRIVNGQLNLARDGGKPKKVGAVAITHGMKRVTTGALHPYAHGQAIDDEPMEKSFNTGRSDPLHDGQATHMNSAHERGWAPQPGDASKHLRAASRISARDAEMSKAEGFDHSFIGHRVGKQSLPSSKRKLSD